MDISDEQIRTQIGCLWKVVGNTPMMAVHFTYKGHRRTIYAKLEAFNFTGSIKDRMALYVLQESYRNGSLKSGDIICEATSGNTGIAFSSIGRALGHHTRIFMPNWLSRERIDVIKAVGADIVLVSKEEGGFLGSIKMTQELAQSHDNVFLPCQFTNELNSEAHEKTTAIEVIEQLASIGKSPDAFVAGVGTGGTVMGVLKAFRSMIPNAKVYPMEPAESPTLSTGYKVGSHRIQGISDEFIPEIVKLNELDEIISVSDGDAILMAQALTSILGISVGISSGANFLAAIKAQELLENPSAVVATIFCDCNKKYLSTDLMKQEPIKDDYISQNVELHSMNIIPSLDLQTA